MVCDWTMNFSLPALGLLERIASFKLHCTANRYINKARIADAVTAATAISTFAKLVSILSF